MSNYANGYYGDSSRGGAYQPINYIISQTAAKDGTATFLFDAVALSNTWTLTINCSGAPDTAMFIAASGGTTFGQFKGSNSWGPLQLQGGDRLQITATGLIPGTLYQFAGYGYCNTVNEPEIVYPTAYADSVTTSTEQIYLGSSFVPSIGSTTRVVIATIPISPTYRSIYILGTSTTGPNVLSLCSYTAVGNVTNFGYIGVIIPYASNPGQVAVRIPIISSTDTSITLQVIAPSGSAVQNATFYYGGDLANVDVAVYPEGTFNVNVSNANTSPVPVQVVGSIVTSVTMGGDVSGQSNATTVVGIEGKLINGAPTTAGQSLIYTGSLWQTTNATGYSSTAKVVMDQSPAITSATLTTPTLNSATLISSALGTPVSGVLTNTTGLPLTTGVTGTLPVGNGGTGQTSTPATGQLLTGNGTNFQLVPASPQSGYVLTSAAISGGLTWSSPALSYLQSSLASNLALTTTFISTGVLVILTPGTWLVTANVSLQTTTAGSCRISIGPTSASETGAYAGFFPSGSTTTSPLTLSTNRVIVVASTTTVYLNAGYYLSGAGNLLSTSGPGSVPNATELVAVRIG